MTERPNCAVLVAKTALLEVVSLARMASPWFPALAFALPALQTALLAAAQAKIFAPAALLVTSFRERHATSAIKHASLALAVPLSALLASPAVFSILQPTNAKIVREIA